MKILKYIVLSAILGNIPTLVMAYDYNAFGSDQDGCFAKAMIGMDSVINSRLGVPPEHALDLTAKPQKAGVDTKSFDNPTLNVILAAYLWNDTPHAYAVRVFFNCAQQQAFKRQASVE